MIEIINKGKSSLKKLKTYTNKQTGIGLRADNKNFQYTPGQRFGENLCKTFLFIPSNKRYMILALTLPNFSQLFMKTEREEDSKLFKGWETINV